VLRAAGLQRPNKSLSLLEALTSASVAWHSALGLHESNYARAFHVRTGCIQAAEFATRTPAPQASQHDKRLQKGLDPSNRAFASRNYVKTSYKKKFEMIAPACRSTVRSRTYPVTIFIRNFNLPAGTRPLPTKVWNPDRYLSTWNREADRALRLTIRGVGTLSFTL